MLGLDMLAAGSLLVLAGGPQSLCTTQAPTKINVIPTTKELVFDYKQELSEIQGKTMNTVDPYGFHGVSITQGFMQGAIKIAPKVTIGYQKHTRLKAVCMWYDSIDIEIEIDPKIVIAKEVYKDRCMGKAVKAHEMKHVNADRKIVNKYADLIGKKVYKTLEGRFSTGPVRESNYEQVAERMRQVVFQTVMHEYKKMELERIDDQRDIDSLSEYKSVSAQCPDFNPANPTAKKRHKSRKLYRNSRGHNS